MHIICGKIDETIGFECGPSEAFTARRRIVSDSPAKLSTLSYLPFSTDGRCVLTDAGRERICDFFDRAASNRYVRLIVLTQKEYLLIVEELAMRDLTVAILEDDYPIFANVTHRKNLAHNLTFLKKCLRKIDSLRINGGSFVRDQSSRHLHRIARKIRFKNGLDRFFFFAYCDAFQEVFKFTEERKDRAVIALDFNSMFADCMKGDFCDPATLKKVKYASEAGMGINELPHGIYHVMLQGAKDTFFLKMHPFLFKRLNKSSRFDLNLGDSIEVILFREEIDYYSQFFKKTEVKEGIVSEKVIAHPLLKEADRTYKNRLQFRSCGDETMEKYCRVSLQLMHSATNQKRFKKKRFRGVEDVAKFISTNFNVTFSAGDYFEVDLERFFHKNKYFQIERAGDAVILKYLDIDADCVLYSLSAKILANSRIKMLKTIERMLAFNSLEICYCNVDSIHISIKRSLVDHFLEEYSDIISDEMGALKVQAIADTGYWFDLGRYWLKKGNDVVSFRNKYFNGKDEINEFVRSRRVMKIVRAAAFGYTYSSVHKIENAFSYSKRLCTHAFRSDSIAFTRFNFSEIQTNADADLTETEEVMRSKRMKLSLFDRISGE